MESSSLYQKRKKPLELIALAAIYGAASVSVLLLAGIVGYVFFKGFRVLGWSFFTSVTSSLKGTVGIAGNLVNTLYLIILALLMAVPAGVGAAVYLNEYAKPGRLQKAVESSMKVLAGIPSILFGLFGMVFFGGVLGLGYSLLNGALTLALMILPLIVQNTWEALKTVPDSYRSGALGMGAGKWHMIRTVLLPCAGPGIVTGILLAAGRIAGESAALLFTAGSARLLPKLGKGIGERLVGLWGKIFDSGGTLAIELYLQMQKGEFEPAFGIACVLMLFVLFLNVLLRLAAGGAARLKGR